MQAAESLTAEEADNDMNDAIPRAIRVKRRYDAGHADAIEMVESYLQSWSPPAATAPGWQKLSMIIWDLGPLEQKLPEWTRSRG